MNTDMHEKVAGISNKNGYELYRSNYNSVDAIPAYAEFAYDQSLMQLVPMYAGKVQNLKDLYKFGVVLKKKVNKQKRGIIKGATPQPIEGHLNFLYACKLQTAHQQRRIGNGEVEPRDEGRDQHV